MRDELIEYMGRAVAIQPPHVEGTHIDTRTIDGIEVARFQLDDGSGYAWAWTLDDPDSDLDAIEIRVALREPTVETLRAPKEAE